LLLETDLLSKYPSNFTGWQRRSLLSVCLLVGMASSLAGQTTREALQYLGTSQLDSTAATSIASDDLQVSPHPESDAELAGVNRGPGTAAVPLITSPQGISPALSGVGLTFNGLSHRDQRIAGTGLYANTQFSTEPPDQGLTVGNGFVLQTVNAALAIYDASSGALRQGPTALNQFFRLKPEISRANGTYGDFTSDPRAYYDSQVQRWFVTVVAMATNSETGIFSAPTRLLIAVSNTSDPTQGWKIYGIETTYDGSQGCPCFGDQPLIATDAHGLFITTNAFSLREGFAGVQIYAVSKRLLTGGAMPVIVHWNAPKLNGGFAFSLQPAIQATFATDDALHGVEYFVSGADIRNMLDRRIAVWSLSNTAALSDPTPVLKLRSTIVPTEPFGVPPDALQKPGSTELGSLIGEKQQFIATNDHRMQQAVFADGKLWSALTTIVAVEGDAVPHAGIAYFALAPSVAPDGAVKAQIVRQGYVVARNADLFYPALAIAPGGNGAIAFMVSGAEYYPSMGFANLTPEGVSEVHILAAGVAPHDGFSGYKYFGGSGSGRTGDYSAAAIDEHGSIWIASEYIPLAPRTLLANWGSFIAQIVPAK